MTDQPVFTPNTPETGNPAVGDVIVIDTPTGIEYARLAAIKGRLRLEMAGIRFKGRATTTIVRELIADHTGHDVDRLTRKKALNWVVLRMAELLAQRESDAIAEAHHHAGHHWNHTDSGCKLCRERLRDYVPTDAEKADDALLGFGDDHFGDDAPLTGDEF